MVLNFLHSIQIAVGYLSYWNFLGLLLSQPMNDINTLLLEDGNKSSSQDTVFS